MSNELGLQALQVVSRVKGAGRRGGAKGGGGARGGGRGVIQSNSVVRRFSSSKSRQSAFDVYCLLEFVRSVISFDWEWIFLGEEEERV